MMAWLLIPALLVSVPAFSRGEDLIGTEEEMLALLSLNRSRGASRIEVRLTGGYFSRLSENNFREYSVLKLKTGIAFCDMKYSSEAYMLFMENIQWTEPHVLEAATEQEFRKAFQYFMEQGASEFQVIVRDQRLFESLRNKGRAFAYASMYGAETLQVRISQDPPYIFYLDEIQPFTDPWYSVSSRDDWIRGTESMAARNASHFFLVLDPFFAETLQRDETLIR